MNDPFLANIQPASPLSATVPAEPPKNKGGRPKGFNGKTSKQPSAIARAFSKAGLDWKTDFAIAIKAAADYTRTPAIRKAAKERVQLWLRLLPYLITTSSKASIARHGRYKNKPSKAAMAALHTLEGE